MVFLVRKSPASVVVGFRGGGGGKDQETSPDARHPPSDDGMGAVARHRFAMA